MSEPNQATAAPQAPTAGNNRPGNGQFAKGNPGGPGNPFARQVAASKPPSTNGHKRPSPNGGKRRLVNGKLVPA
jgi:hypothetical protein